jgi:hypothetical protein
MQRGPPADHEIARRSRNEAVSPLRGGRCVQGSCHSARRQADAGPPCSIPVRRGVEVSERRLRLFRDADALSRKAQPARPSGAASRPSALPLEDHGARREIRSGHPVRQRPRPRMAACCGIRVVVRPPSGINVGGSRQRASQQIFDLRKRQDHRVRVSVLQVRMQRRICPRHGPISGRLRRRP